MFDRFIRNQFQSLKLSKLTADMVLHGWLKFWTRLSERLCEFHKVLYGHQPKKTGPEEAQYFHVRPPIGFI